MDVLGSLSFLQTPDVNNDLVLTSDNGITSFSAGTIGFRPTPGVLGRIYLATDTNRFFYDDGSAWIDTTQVPLIDGTAGQIVVVDGTNSTPAIVSLATNPVLPGSAGVTMPAGTTAERSSTPASADTRFNTSVSKLETYNGSYWCQHGTVLQVVTGTIAASSGTSTIPFDNTTPLVTEGNQIWTHTFNPISATSRVIIQFSITAAASISSSLVTCALFAGNTIIGAVSQRAAQSNNQPFSMSVSRVWVPGSTAGVTLQARLGGNVASTTYCNTTSTGSLGGALVSSYIITEIE